MKYRLPLAAVIIPMLFACGGGGGGTTGNGGDGDNNGQNEQPGNANTCCLQEDRPRPGSGAVKTSSISGSSVVSTGSTGNAGTGPVTNNIDSPNNFPVLAVSDFLWVNNAFNFFNTRFAGWFQEIELTGSSGNLTPTVRYDWGTEGALRNQFATVSFPELIYGVKSPGERSASFAATGLPIENSSLPAQINIDYNYTYTQTASSSPNTETNEDFTGFNVAIESFWHDSCNIVRTNSDDDNQVFELMVWLHLGKRGPVGEGRNGAAGSFTTSDGRVWDVFSKVDAFFRGATVRNYLAFVARDEQSSGTIPYHEFINEARTNAANYGDGAWRFLQDTDCLANILLGSEIWYGAGSFQWNDVSIRQVY